MAPALRSRASLAVPSCRATGHHRSLAAGRDPRRTGGCAVGSPKPLKARDLAALYGAAASLPGTAWAERWNGAPTQTSLACRLDGTGRRVLSLLRRGLVPSWARDREPAHQCAPETVHEHIGRLSRGHSSGDTWFAVFLEQVVDGFDDD